MVSRFRRFNVKIRKSEKRLLTKLTNIKIHTTKVLDYNNYVDLCTIDGELKTIQYEKSKEPNIFSLKKEFSGDQIQSVMDSFSGSNAQ